MGRSRRKDILREKRQRNNDLNSDADSVLRGPVSSHAGMVDSFLLSVSSGDSRSGTHADLYNGSVRSEKVAGTKRGQRRSVASCWGMVWKLVSFTSFPPYR